MSAIFWKNNVSGNWAVAANWSGGVLPGATDSVTLSTLASVTITYSTGTTTIASLTATTDVLDVTGGTLDILAGASFGQGLTISGGVLGLAGAASTVTGSFAGLGGQITLATGSTLKLAGTTTLGTTAFADNGPAIDGAGTLTTTGSLVLAASSYNALTLGGGITWNIGDNVTVGEQITTGDGAGLTATINNTAGFTFDLTADIAGIIDGQPYNGSPVGTSTFSNAGTFAKTGGTGTSRVQSVFNNTGVVVAGSGTIEFDNGGNFGGSLTGTGQLAFAGGTATLAGGAALAVGALLFDGAAATLSHATNFAGAVTLDAGSLTLDGASNSFATFSQYYGTAPHLLLNGGTLALNNALLGSGWAEGPGLLTTAGTTSISGYNGQGYVFGGGITWSNTGAVTQNYYVYVDDSLAGGFTIANAASASYTLASGVYLGTQANNGPSTSSTFNNAGTFTQGAGTSASYIQSVFNNTGIIAGNGANLEFDGGGVFGGSITGTGVVSFGSGSTTIAATAAITVSEFLTDGATVTQAGNLSLGNGDFVETAGLWQLNGFNLALGNGQLLNGAMSGPGTVSLAGSSAIGNLGSSSLSFGGGIALVNSGVTEVFGTIYVNYPTGAGFAITNSAGATFALFGDYTLGLNANTTATATFDNLGLYALDFGTGTQVVDATFTNTGTIASATGDIQFAAGGVFGGKLTGAGTISFAGGNATLASGVALSAAGLLLDGANVTLSANTAIGGGAFDLTAGTLFLNGTTLSLTNGNFANGVIAGAGALSTAGTTQIGYAPSGGTAYFSNNVLWTNSGTVNDNYNLYIVYQNGNGFTLTNLASATYDLTGNYTVGGNNYNSTSSTINNAGLFEQTAGTNASVVASVFNNTGTIDAAVGGIQFNAGGSFGGKLAGPGYVALAGGNATIAAGAALGVSQLYFNGANVTLTANQALGTGDTLLLTAGNLFLGGNTLTLVSADLGGGQITGPGTILTSGTTTLGGYNNATPYFASGVQLTNSGTLNINYNVNIVYQDGNGFTLTNAAGASLDFLANYTIGGNNNNGTSSYITNAGTFGQNGPTGNSAVDSVFTNASTGVINVATGSISFYSGGTFGGSIAGAGALGFNYTAYNWGNLTDKATALYLYQSGVTVTASSTDGSLLNTVQSTLILDSGATLSVGTLTVTQAGGGLPIQGPGTLSTTGSANIVDWYSNGLMLTIGGGATWSNSGTVTDGGLTQIGNGTVINGTSAGTLINAAKGVFQLTTDDASIIRGSYINAYGQTLTSGAVFTNAGLLEKTGGSNTSYVEVALVSTGTLGSTSGTLELYAGGTLSGAILAGSTLVLAPGSFTDGALAVGGGTTLTNAGTIAATGLLKLGDTSANAVLFTNTGTYDFTAAAGIFQGSAAATFTNTGLIENTEATGTTTISAPMTNSGTILAAAGTLNLASAVLGTGTVLIGAGATLELGSGVVGTQGVTFTAATGTLLLAAPAAPPETVTGLVVGDTIDFAKLTITKVSVNGADQLIALNGTTQVAKVQLSGSYLSDTFSLASDANGGTNVTLSGAATAWKGTTADWYAVNVWSNGAPNLQTNTAVALSGSYTLTLAGGETGAVNKLTIAGTQADCVISGTLNAASVINVAAGTFALGGLLNGGTLDSNGGTVIFTGGVLQNVAYQGALNLTGANQSVSLAGSTSLAGRNGAGAATIALTGTGATMFVDGYATLNSATLGIGSASGASAVLRGIDTTGQGEILTLGSALTVTQSGLFAAFADGGAASDALISSAKIVAATSGGTFSVTGNTFENDGSIAVSNGDTFSITPAQFINTGSLTVTAATLGIGGVFLDTGNFTATGSVLDFNTTLTNTELTKITAGGGDKLNLAGTLNAAGSALAVGGTAKLTALNLSGTVANAVITAAAGAFTFSNGATLNGDTFNGTMAVGGGVAVTLAGTLTNAVIADAGGGLLFAPGAVLKHTTYQGTLSFAAGTSLTVQGGIALKGPGGTGAAAINVNSGATAAQIGFADSETLANVAITSIATAAGTQGLFLAPQVAAGGILALASTARWEVQQGAVSGFLSVSPATGLPLGNGVVNAGKIILDAGAVFVGSPSSLGTFVNNGGIALGSNALWETNGTLATGSAFTNGATGAISLAAGAAFTTNAGSFTNAGTVSVAAGASFTENGPTTLASVQKVGGAGTLGIDGVLNLGGGTYSMAASGAVATVQIGGEIETGTFVNTAGSVTFGSLATLSAVTWKGALAIGAGSTVDVLGALAVQTAAGGSPGTIALANDGGISFGTAGTLTNVTITTASPSASDTTTSLADVINFSAAGGTLTFGTGFTLDANAGAAELAALPAGAPPATTIANSGHILVNAGELWLDPSVGTFTNAGTIALAAGTGFGPTPGSTGNGSFGNTGLISLGAQANFDLIGNAASAGTVVVGVGAEISAGGNFANTGSVTLSGGASLTATGALSNLGGHILASGATGNFVAGSGIAGSALVNGTLVGGVFSVSAGSTLTLDFGNSLTTDAADIVLSGANSVLRSTGTSIARLESTLATIAAGGTLALLTGHNYSTALALTDAGTLQVQGGILTAAGVTLGAAGLLTGSGVVASTVANGGTVAASGGTLTLSKGATGAGGLQIAASSELVLGAASAETVTFGGASAELALVAPTSFTGTLAGFAKTDSILLESTAATKAVLSGATLTVSLSGGSTEIFAVAGNTATVTLTVAAAGANTLLTYPAALLSKVGGGPVSPAAPAQAALLPDFAPARLLAPHLAGAAPTAAALTPRDIAASETAWAGHLHAQGDAHAIFLPLGRA